MRILFVTHSLNATGATVALLDRVRYLTARGDQATVLLPAKLQGGATALADSFRACGCALVDKASAADFDVMIVSSIVNWQHVSVKAAAARPLLWWIHEGRIGELLTSREPKMRAAFQVPIRLIFPNEAIVRAFYAPLLRDLAPRRIAIVPYAAREAARPAKPPAKREGWTHIVCVGSIYQRKRQADLVRAVAAVTEKPIECTLVGEFIEMDDEAAQVARGNPDRFHLPGAVDPDKVQEIYGSADAFCLPSEDEALAIAPLEAARHGLPLVLSDIAAYEGLYRHGINALIHPVGDVMLLGWYLRMLAWSPQLRERLGAQARATAASFTAKRFNALFDAAVEDAVAEWSAARPRAAAEPGPRA